MVVYKKRLLNSDESEDVNHDELNVKYQKLKSYNIVLRNYIRLQNTQLTQKKKELKRQKDSFTFLLCFAYAQLFVYVIAIIYCIYCHVFN